MSGAIDATLQPDAVKCDIVGTEPFKTPAKRSLEKSPHGLRVHRGELDIVEHMMLCFGASCMDATCQIRQTPAECCTSLTAKSNSHFLDNICRFTAGTKKEALSRLF